MKKSILFLALSLVTGVLTGCAKDEQVSKPKIDYTDYIKYNLPDEVEDQMSNVNKTNVTIRDLKIPDGYLVYDLYDGFCTDGFLVPIVNPEGYFGIYNAIYGKFILAPQYKISELNNGINPFDLIYRRYNAYAEIGLCIVDILGKTIILDTIGNVIYDGDFLQDKDRIYVYTRNLSNHELLGLKDVVLEFSINSSEEPISTYLYKKDGTLITEAEAFKLYVDYETREAKDLTVIGYPGYTLRINPYSDRVVIFDEKGQLYSSYQLKVDFSNFDEYGIIGQKMIFQERWEIDAADKTQNYTFEYNGDRYLMETYSMDIISGVIEKLPNTHRIYDITPLKDKDGNYSMSIVRADPIKNKLRVRTDDDYLIDKNFNLLEVTQNNPIDDIFKLSDDRYCDHNHLYNENLDIIANFEPFELLDFDPEKRLIFGINYAMEQMQILDFDGKILKSFNEEIFIIFGREYGSIVGLRKDNSNDTYFITFFDDNLEEIRTIKAEHFEPFDENSDLFIIERKNSVGKNIRSLLNLKGEEILLEDTNLGVAAYRLGLSNDDNCYYRVTPIYGTREFKLELININSEIKVKTYGVEKKEAVENGLNFFTGITLKEDQENVLPITYGSTYAKFIPSKTGLYELKTDKETFSYFYYLDMGVISFCTTAYDDKFILKKGVTYYIEMSIDSDATSIKATLEFAEIPTLSADEEVVNYDPAKGYLLRLFKPTETGYYSMNASKCWSTYNDIFPAKTLSKDGELYYYLEAGEEYVFVWDSLILGEVKISKISKLAKDDLIAQRQVDKFTYKESDKTYVANGSKTSNASIIYDVAPGVLKLECDLSYDLQGTSLLISVDDNIVRVIEEKGKQTITIELTTKNVTMHKVEITYRNSNNDPRSKCIIKELELVSTY